MHETVCNSNEVLLVHHIVGYVVFVFVLIMLWVHRHSLSYRKVTKKLRNLVWTLVFSLNV